MNLPKATAQYVLDAHIDNSWTKVDLAHMRRDATLAEATTQAAALPATSTELVRHQPA